MSGDAAVATAALNDASSSSFRQPIETSEDSRERAAVPVRATVGGSDGGRVTRLEAEVGELREELDKLNAQFAEFRKQFE
jgi:hypothetical protein